MKKIFITLAALAVAAMAMATSSMAAKFDLDKDTISLEADISSVSGQATVVVAEAVPYDDGGVTKYRRPDTLDDDDILYMDQVEKADGIFQDMAVKGELTEGTTYVILVGGENLSESGIIEEYVTIASDGTIKVLWGDLNMDGSIVVEDAAQIISYLCGATVTNKKGYTIAASSCEDFLWGDITMDGSIVVEDAAQIISYLCGTTVTNKYNYEIGKEYDMILSK